LESSSIVEFDWFYGMIPGGLGLWAYPSYYL
jgi:hypothetical protein